MNKKLVSIGESLKHILKDYNLEARFNEQFIVQNWTSIIKNPMVNILKPVRLEESVITLQAISESWKKEMMLKKKEIIKIINSSQDKIKIDDVLII